MKKSSKAVQNSKNLYTAEDSKGNAVDTAAHSRNKKVKIFYPPNETIYVYGKEEERIARYRTDGEARVIYARAVLRSLTPAQRFDRSSHQQTLVVRLFKEMYPTDEAYEGSHIIAAVFGGLPSAINLLALPRDVNQKSMGNFEKEIQAHLKEIAKTSARITVKMEVFITYDHPNSPSPQKLRIEVWDIYRSKRTLWRKRTILI